MGALLCVPVGSCKFPWTGQNWGDPYLSERRFFTLEEAAPFYGYQSANSLRMAFSRGTFPQQFLRHLGKRKILVDRAGLDEWIARSGPKLKQGELF